MSHCLPGGLAVEPLQQALQQNRALHRSTTQAHRHAADVELYSSTALYTSLQLYSALHSTSSTPSLRFSRATARMSFTKHSPPLRRPSTTKDEKIEGSKSNSKLRRIPGLAVCGTIFSPPRDISRYSVSPRREIWRGPGIGYRGIPRDTDTGRYREIPGDTRYVAGFTAIVGK